MLKNCAGTKNNLEYSMTSLCRIKGGFNKIWRSQITKLFEALGAIGIYSLVKVLLEKLIFIKWRKFQPLWSSEFQCCDQENPPLDPNRNWINPVYILTSY
jgi:hypothetical protein